MASRGRQRRGAAVKMGLFLAWIALVTLFLFFEAVTYSGLMSLLAEWEYNAFGRHYPTFTLALFVFVLGLPGYLLFLRPRRTVGRELPEAAVLRSARTLLNVVFGGAAALGVTALAVVVVMLFLPREGGEPQRIDLSKPLLSVPREGPVTISGSIIYERTAGLDKNLLLVRQSSRFVPIVGPRADPATLQFFVQLPPVDDRTRAGVATVTGILKQDGLPGAILRLYRYAGYRVEEPHYVVFVDPAVMRWPYISTIVQFAIGAVLAVLLGLLQRRRVRRLDDAIHTRAES